MEGAPGKAVGVGTPAAAVGVVVTPPAAGGTVRRRRVGEAGRKARFGVGVVVGEGRSLWLGVLGVSLCRLRGGDGGRVVGVWGFWCGGRFVGVVGVVVGGRAGACRRVPGRLSRLLVGSKVLGLFGAWGYSSLGGLDDVVAVERKEGTMGVVRRRRVGSRRLRGGVGRIVRVGVEPWMLLGGIRSRGGL